MAEIYEDWIGSPPPLVSSTGRVWFYVPGDSCRWAESVADRISPSWRRKRCFNHRALGWWGSYLASSLRAPPRHTCGGWCPLEALPRPFFIFWGQETLSQGPQALYSMPSWHRSCCPMEDLRHNCVRWAVGHSVYRHCRSPSHWQEDGILHYLSGLFLLVLDFDFVEGPHGSDDQQCPFGKGLFHALEFPGGSCWIEGRISQDRCEKSSLKHWVFRRYSPLPIIQKAIASMSSHCAMNKMHQALLYDGTPAPY